MRQLGYLQAELFTKLSHEPEIGMIFWQVGVFFFSFSIYCLKSMEYANAKSMEYVIIMKRYIDKYCDMIFDMIINLKQYVGDWGKNFGTWEKKKRKSGRITGKW